MASSQQHPPEAPTDLLRASQPLGKKTVQPARAQHTKSQTSRAADCPSLQRKVGARVCVRKEVEGWLPHQKGSPSALQAPGILGKYSGVAQNRGPLPPLLEKSPVGLHPSHSNKPPLLPVPCPRCPPGPHKQPGGRLELGNWDVGSRATRAAKGIQEGFTSREALKGHVWRAQGAQHPLGTTQLPQLGAGDAAGPTSVLGERVLSGEDRGRGHCEAGPAGLGPGLCTATQTTSQCPRRLHGADWARQAGPAGVRENG